MKRFRAKEWISYGLIVIGMMVCSIYLLQNLYWNDSEELVVSPMIASVLDLDISTGGYGLGTLRSTSNPEGDIFSALGDVDNLKNGYTYSSYCSQIGLQGIVCRIMAKIVPKLGLFLYLRYVCIFLFDAVIFLIILQIRQKYGLLFSLIFGITSLVSPWLLKFSSNLYWVQFTWFIPMLLGLCCLNYEKKRKLIYPFFFMAVFIKCLCGYEYLSTVMMSGIMFLIVEWICNKKKRKEMAKTIIIVGTCSVLGFITAYLIHAYLFGNGNIIGGLKSLQVGLIQRRTFGNSADFDPVFADSLNASIFDVLKKYLCSSGSYFYGLLFCISLAALFYQRKCLKKNNTFEISIFFFSFFSTVSWFILGKAHSYIHTHLNFVLFYMGWVQVSCYIICNVLLESKKLRLEFIKDKEV